MAPALIRQEQKSNPRQWAKAKHAENIAERSRNLHGNSRRPEIRLSRFKARAVLAGYELNGRSRRSKGDVIKMINAPKHLFDGRIRHLPCLATLAEESRTIITSITEARIVSFVKHRALIRGARLSMTVQWTVTRLAQMVRYKVKTDLAEHVTSRPSMPH